MARDGGWTVFAPKPKGVKTAAQGFDPELFTQLGGETPDSWKTSRGAKEHRLEAYATLVFRTVGDLSEPSW